MSLDTVITDNIPHIGERVLEREMERKMNRYKSYAGIHQPKNERQPDFRHPYSTFFVRFDDEQVIRFNPSFYLLVKSVIKRP